MLGPFMDVIYQLIVLRTFAPGEVAILAIALAFFLYFLLVVRTDRYQTRNQLHGEPYQDRLACEEDWQSPLAVCVRLRP